SDAKARFGRLGEGHPQASTQDSGHGRKEHRKAVVVSAKGLAEHHEFPGLKAFGLIEATRELNGKTSSETRYFALPWMPESEVLLATVRAHCAIENVLHWQLDVSFREDAPCNRKDNAPGNIAVLRRRALDVVRQDTSKGSLSIKLKRAGWNEDFLRSILNGLKAPAPES
ncbi:ISAs1 family transposase, partial [Marivita sp.]|uniref:ISAs1 family transposase n=1 Tax=Marivita sp. TaxID=2003365 RepID=UPI003F723717